ncbi:Ras GTPase ras2, partial [Mortierella sp. AM989]
MICYKLVVSGDVEAGIAEMVTQFSLKHVNTTYDPTVGIAYGIRVVIDDQPCFVEIINVNIGQEYKAMREHYIREGEGVLLVYSLAARRTFEVIQRYHDEILSIKRTEDIPIMLIGTNCERLTEREVSRDEGALKAESLRCGFTEGSVKTWEGVDDAVFNLICMIREAHKNCVPPETAKKTEEKMIDATWAVMQTSEIYSSNATHTGRHTGTSEVYALGLTLNMSVAMVAGIEHSFDSDMPENTASWIKECDMEMEDMDLM